MISKPENFAEYIETFPKEIRDILESIRATIRQAAPDAVEGISYAMPAFKLNNTPLVYFAAFTNHIGLYALPSGNEAFKAELAAYKTGKGSIQFPLSKPIPLDLITKIVEFRKMEVKSKAK